MVRGYGRTGHGLFAQPDREKRRRRWREGSINWKPNTSRPFGISFWYTERAECPVFMGECQIRQMTWSLLQWRWSLLMHRGAWRRIQGEQLGGSLRNRPAVYAQLCRELSFLNIHIFNELKRLSPHTDAVHPWRICSSRKGGESGESFPAGQMFVQFMILLPCPMEVTWHPPLVWSFLVYCLLTNQLKNVWIIWMGQKTAHFICDVLDSRATLTFDLPKMTDQDQSQLALNIKQPTMLWSLLAVYISTRLQII